MSTAFFVDQSTGLAEAPTNPQDLWQRYHQRADATTENALVEQYLPLVAAVRGRLAMTLPEHVDGDDLYSAGLIGLLQALRNYNPACGASFESYARVRIRGSMLDELRRMDWVPRTVHEKARRLREVMIALEQKLGGVPTEAQMAEALNIPVAEYARQLEQARPASFVCLDSVNDTDESDSGSSLYEVIASPGDDDTVEQVSHQELKEIILSRIQELPEMQRKVLALYYGEDLHLREIAEAFGLTESRICQIHSQAILSIRAYIQRFEAGMAGQTFKRS
jgi:RNA polymerase sigma factor for flagellar operon FliA